MSWKIAWFTGAIVVAITGGVLIFGAIKAPERARAFAASAEKAPQPLSNASELEGMRAELGRMRSQIAGLRNNLAEQQAPASAPAPSAAPVSIDQLSAAELRAGREEDARRWKDHMAEVALAFNDETFDRSFSTRATGALDEAMRSNPVIKGAAEKLDCRSRTCRLEIKDAMNDTVATQLPLFLMSLHGSLPNMQADNFEAPNGKTTVVLYLTNEMTAQNSEPGR